MSLTTLPTDAFHLEDQDLWAAKTAVIDRWALPSCSVGDLNLNREGTIVTKPEEHPAFAGRKAVLDRFHVGFEWKADDGGTARWIPQGLTGAADSGETGEGGRQWLAASWHSEQDDVEKGMRMSLVDGTDWTNPIRYRNILLVNPIAAGDGPPNHDTFVPIPAHAGGVVWFRDYLYVADSRGFADGRPGGVLVFDMARIKEVDDSRDDLMGWSPAHRTYYAFGYRYVLPQVGRYRQVAADAGKPLRWSFLGLDRTGAKRSLMIGEYATSDEAPGRLIWWGLDARTGRLAVTSPGQPLGATLARACSDERFLQGGHSHDAFADGTVWLSRSSGHDALYERPIGGGRGITHEPWADQPEGLTYSPASDNLWCITERAGARAVFAVKRQTV